MLKVVEKPLKAVPFPVSDPEFIPAQRYYDEEFYKLECERFWPHVWQMACRLEEIPKVGDWTEYKIFDKSVIVVRTDTAIKAHHNACRHRGVQVAHGHGNCKRGGFTCPFHGWRYGMNGENTFVYKPQLFSEKALEKDDLALVPCRVEVWGGCAFINFDDNAPSLRESLGPVAERLDGHAVDKLKVDWWHSTVLPVNWKLAMEAFMEGYHVMRTHPQLQALNTVAPEDFIDITVSHMAKLSAGMGGMIHASELAIAEGLRSMKVSGDLPTVAKTFSTRLRDEITTQGRARGVPVPDLNAIAVTHPVSPVEYLFPHYFLLPMFSAMSSYRIRPLSPETCLFDLWSLSLYPENEERPKPVAPTPVSHDNPIFPEIPRQDYSNLPLQQLGLHAVGFEHMRLSKDTEGLISNYQRLIDGYLAGVDPAKLAKASQIVCCGLDSKILDIGF